ncbi:MAG: hypothetical protein AABY22_33465 [Nanoarchaeota archaeon]
MKIDKIEFKLTTTDKIICSKCKGPIEGREGYIKISLNIERGGYMTGGNLFIKICHKCFEEAVVEYYAKRKTRDRDWKRLLKSRILTGLR